MLSSSTTRDFTVLPQWKYRWNGFIWHFLNKFIEITKKRFSKEVLNVFYINRKDFCRYSYLIRRRIKNKSNASLESYFVHVWMRNWADVIISLLRACSIGEASWSSWLRQVESTDGFSLPKNRMLFRIIPDGAFFFFVEYSGRLMKINNYTV